MADTIQITAGSGTVVKTDQLADNSHVQYVKLLDGTADSAAVIVGDATSGLYVNVKVLPALVAGTAAIGKLAANTGVDIGDVDVLSMPTGASAAQVQGTVAHDAAAADNPVPMAGIGVSADPAVVQTGDVVRLIASLTGKLVVLPYSIVAQTVYGVTADITNTASTIVLAAAGAGIRNYITSALVQNSHATVSTWVNIQDGSGGTALHTVYALAAGGGASIILPVPLKTTANTGLYVACVTTGANVRVSVAGFTGA